jgi:hypothetical protein
MVRAELKVDADCPEGMIISGMRIGDGLSKRYDLKG